MPIRRPGSAEVEWGKLGIDDSRTSDVWGAIYPFVGRKYRFQSEESKTESTPVVIELTRKAWELESYDT